MKVTDVSFIKQTFAICSMFNGKPVNCERVFHVYSLSKSKVYTYMYMYLLLALSLRDERWNIIQCRKCYHMYMYMYMYNIAYSKKVATDRHSINFIYLFLCWCSIIT